VFVGDRIALLWSIATFQQYYLLHVFFFRYIFKYENSHFGNVLGTLLTQSLTHSQCCVLAATERTVVLSAA
jgi:hypothetical protein